MAILHETAVHLDNRTARSLRFGAYITFDPHNALGI
jgi:hypothetical protein